MSERPLLYSESMVAAVLRDIKPKTQTRRIMDPQPEAPAPIHELANAVTSHLATVLPNRLVSFLWRTTGVGDVVKDRPAVDHVSAKRWGKLFEVDDVIWVREAWRPYSWHDGEIEVEFRDGRRTFADTMVVDEEAFEDWQLNQWMKLSDELISKGFESDGECFPEEAQKSLRWRPGIHMPRAFANIFLKVTEVRVQQLQAITEEDAAAEGCAFVFDPNDDKQWRVVTRGKAELSTGRTVYGSCRTCFEDLWDDINGHRDGGTWDDNPWVQAVTFERIEKP